MNVITVGIDLAKNVFSVHGVDIAQRPCGLPGWAYLRSTARRSLCTCSLHLRDEFAATVLAHSCFFQHKLLAIGAAHVRVGCGRVWILLL